MANLIPQELEDLIQEYLTDGVITTKERQVLLNKAASLGLNVDEVDLYIDAQQQKADQAVNAAISKQRGKTCPHCGAPVPQLTDKCPECGGAITPEASAELKEIMESLEEALVDLKSGSDFKRSKAHVEKNLRKAELYYSSNPKVKTLIEQVKKETEIAEKAAKSEAKKKTLVKILTYNKWVTAIVILLLIGGAVMLFKGPNLREDPEACVEAVNKALNKDNPSEAEFLLSNFSKGKHEVKAGYAALVNYYLDKEDNEKAAQFLEYADDALRSRVEMTLLNAGEKNLNKWVAEGNTNALFSEISSFNIPTRPALGTVKGDHYGEIGDDYTDYNKAVKELNEYCYKVITIAVENNKKELANKILKRMKPSLEYVILGDWAKVVEHTTNSSVYNAFEVTENNEDIQAAERLINE